ncbi:hypothetical protein DRN98_08650 [Methanosarcinales archaeon]|nr:MAG: hypothetical protein DRN98_08650 [Methanosarcinales archaeon]
MILFCLFFLNQKLCIAQTQDLSQLKGDTLVVHGKSELYHMNRLDLKSDLTLNEGDLITISYVEGNWVKIQLIPSGLTKWMYFDSNKLNNNITFEKQDRTISKLVTRISKLEKKVITLEEKLSKLEKSSTSTSAAKSIPTSIFTSKPSDQEIEIAVKNYLKKQVPISWVGNLMGGKNAQVSSVQVIEVGIYNNDRKYWPMRIRCVGSCELVDPFNQGKRISFDRIGEFILYKDDFGNWQAEMKGGLFQ